MATLIHGADLSSRTTLPFPARVAIACQMCREWAVQVVRCKTKCLHTPLPQEGERVAGGKVEDGVPRRGPRAVISRVAIGPWSFN